MKITKGMVRSWSRLGQRATFFAMAMPEIAAEKEDVYVLTADLAQLSNLNKFASLYPDRFINVGIAEQNMVGIASGLAMEGNCVFATTYSSFIAVRSLESVRQHISHLRLNVKLVGTAAGVVAARSGVAHWATEDVAFMRSLPGMRIICPSDSNQAYQAAHYAASTDQPMYIRLSGAPDCPIIYDENYVFDPDRISILREGSDVALLASGLVVHEAVEAAKLLEERGISCTVADVHTIKPLDTETLGRIMSSHRLIATAEEHNIIGGLGGAVAEFKAGLSASPRQIFIGMNDSFDVIAGSQRYIWEQFGITAEKIAERIEKEFDKR